MSWEPCFPHTLSCFRWEGKSAPCYTILTRHGNHPAVGFNLKKNFFKQKFKKKSDCPPTPSLKFQRQPHSTFSWYLPPDVVPTLTTALPGGPSPTLRCLKQRPRSALCRCPAALFSVGLFISWLRCIHACVCSGPLSLDRMHAPWSLSSCLFCSLLNPQSPRATSEYVVVTQ